VFHRTGFRRDGSGRLPGLDPERRSYFSFASFNDPDGNEWLQQEIRQPLPGRRRRSSQLTMDVATLAELLRETAEHHDPYENRIRRTTRGLCTRLTCMLARRAAQLPKPPRRPGATWRNLRGSPHCDATTGVAADGLRRGITDDIREAVVLGFEPRSWLRVNASWLLR
jgi:hypothetical protein